MRYSLRRNAHIAAANLGWQDDVAHPGSQRSLFVGVAAS
jgi:hypothetical protein